MTSCDDRGARLENVSTHLRQNTGVAHSVAKKSALTHSDQEQDPCDEVAGFTLSGY